MRLTLPDTSHWSTAAFSLAVSLAAVSRTTNTSTVESSATRCLLNNTKRKSMLHWKALSTCLLWEQSQSFNYLQYEPNTRVATNWLKVLLTFIISTSRNLSFLIVSNGTSGPYTKKKRKGSKNVRRSIQKKITFSSIVQYKNEFAMRDKWLLQVQHCELLRLGGRDHYSIEKKKEQIFCVRFQSRVGAEIN
jgi:hypothetical protein